MKPGYQPNFDMKIYSNKQSKPTKSKVASSSGEKERVRMEVEKISNGYILTKSWEEKNKQGYTDYKSVKEYHKENPIQV
jgi:hypothetical protein